MMQCTRCGNEDPLYFYHGTNGWYCRKCVMFRRQYLNQEIEIKEPIETHEVISDYSLSFSLTPAQQKVSDTICANVLAGKCVLVEAVTGAGKTELVYETIHQALSRGWKVCFAIPRRQVVLQIAERIQEAFSSCKVVAVCEGHTQDVYGDVIVCTTHQLYRYASEKGYFDLLILDEPDAFPYANNLMLETISHHACQKARVEMTATFEPSVIAQRTKEGWQHVRLSCRPSGKPMPIPHEVYALKGLLWIRLTKWMWEKKKLGRQCLIFFPSISLMERVAKGYRHLFSLNCLSSQTEQKEDIIQQFQQKSIEFLFTTTVLERGVTFPGIDIAVMYADHVSYTMAGLVQIAGRVGRSVKDPSGEGVFFCRKHTEAIQGCIQNLKDNNHSAYGV